MPDPEETTERPTGHGTPTGTPSHDADQAPPSIDQEKNEAVSGGGQVDTSGHEASEKARRS